MKKLLMIALAVFTFSCSSDDDGPNNNPDPQPTEYAYMRGKMNNVDFDYTVNNAAADSFIYNAVGGYNGLGSEKWYYYGGSLASFNPPNFAPEMLIAWDNIYYSSGTGADLEKEQFYTTVSNLPTNFLTYAQQDANLPGITIQFTDAQGKIYNTIYGSQSGSSLSVAGSSQDVVMGQKIKTVWGTFSCKVYNDDNASDMKQITNGTFKIILTPNN